MVFVVIVLKDLRAAASVVAQVAGLRSDISVSSFSEQTNEEVADCIVAFGDGTAHASSASSSVAHQIRVRVVCAGDGSSSLEIVCATTNGGVGAARAWRASVRFGGSNFAATIESEA